MMKKYLIKTTSLFCFLALLSWTFQSSDQINRASWLIGTWENKTARGSVYESWKRIDGNELFGFSYSLNGKDTIIFEEIQLIQDQDSLFYIPTVKNQNDGLPIQFALTSMTDTSMVFQHPYHDFPQKITYRLIHQDSLVASIYGEHQGDSRTIEFPMKRIE